MTSKRRPFGYWSEKTIIIELKSVIEELGHFPTSRELVRINKEDLLAVMYRYGGNNYFRKLLGCESPRRTNLYSTEETTINELKMIIKELGKFPTQRKLGKLNRYDLIGAIRKHGGLNRFREILGYDKVQKPTNYWTEKLIIIELESIIEELGDFPMQKNLVNLKRYDLLNAIDKYGGIVHFRELLNYESNYNLWNEEKIIEELNYVSKDLLYFPSQNELINMKKTKLLGAITKHGGLVHFWEVLGINITEKQKTQSVIASYVSKRGNKSEKIVKELITKWCYVHNLPQPVFNVKLSKGNVIEFVCESSLRIGIDVTNTKNKCGGAITHKWKHKQYHIHLDELWIVVFSDIYTEDDYIKFNKQSPDNVKVMSIETFMDELQIIVDKDLQVKIDNYNTCTFHNKDDFSRPKVGLSKYFKIKPDIRVKN